MNHRIFIPVTVAITALLSLPALAQQPVVLEPSDRAFVEVFNLGERAALTEYVRAHFSASALAQRSADERVDELLNLQQRYGRLTPQEVSSVSRVIVVGTDSSRAPQGADVVVVHADEQPQRIEALWIHPATEEIAASVP